MGRQRIYRSGISANHPSPWELLGIATTSNLAEIRRAYRAAIFAAHPDRNDDPSATQHAVALQRAYRAAMLEARRIPPEIPPAAVPQPPRRRLSIKVEFRGVDAATIEVAAPTVVTFAATIAVLGELGQVSYLDRSSLVVQAVLRFTDAPTSYVYAELTPTEDPNVTRIDLGIDSLDAHDAPLVTELWVIFGPPFRRALSDLWPQRHSLGGLIWNHEE